MSFPNLSALAVRERAVTLFFLILSILAGVYAFGSLGRAEDPAFTVRVMVVNAIWPGASAEQVRDQVVDRLEKRIQEVEYLYRLETTVRPGQATLQIEFEDYTPQDKVPDLFYEVRKRMLDEAPSLPDGVIGPLVNDDFADVYFKLMALTAPGLPYQELVREAETIRDRLQRVPGVHKALLLGERTERMYVEFDNARLVNLGLSPQDIFDAIDAANRLVPAGRLETSGPRLHLRVDADLSDPDALTRLPIRAGNKVLHLGEIATIRRGFEEPATTLVRSRGQEAILLGVVMASGENGLALGQRLEAFIEGERRRLPLGQELSVLTHQADAIRAAVDLFQIKFLVAVAVVMAVSILAIGLRAGLIVGIAVPVTLGITFLVMLLMGINLDRITLGALIIALGLLVDDAIIAVEMMLVKMAEGWDRVRAAAHAWNVTAAPMLFGTLVTVAGFLPIGFARSGVGEYAGNIFWVLGIALIVSWLVAVVFVPYLGVKMLKGVTAHGEHDAQYQTPMYQRLRSLVAACVRRRKSVVFGTVLLLLLAGIAMATLVQKQFFPGSDRPEVLVSVYLPQGSAIAATDAVLKRLEGVLDPMPEVRSLLTSVGGGAPRFFISANPEPPDPAFGKIVAVTAGPVERDKVLANLQHRIEAGEFPEARVRAYRLLYGPPVIWPLEFRVIGPDPLKLREIAHSVREIIAANPHTLDAHLEWDERAPALHLTLDEDRLRLIGLTPQDLARQLQFQLEGAPVTELRDGLRTVSLIARGALSRPLDMAAMQSLEVLSRDGRKLPMAQVGRLEIRYEEPVIKRLDREPFVSVRSDIQGAQPNTVTDEVWRALARLRATLPEGYRIDIGGSIEASGKADASIQKLQPVMLAFMLIFIMLQMRSFAGTFMVLATAPLGLIGAVLALYVFNQPFGFVALLGLIGLAGILMRNTLILTQQVADNFEAGMGPFEGVVEAAVQRARPVVLTALAAVLAFIPLTLDSFWGPLAYVLIGGVAVGTVITLLFVPALYAMWFRIQAPSSTGTP